MKKIDSGSCELTFGLEAYTHLGALLARGTYSKIFIITDSNCNELCLPYFLAQLPTDLAFEIIEFESGEEHKTIETCLSIWKVMSELGADRKSVILTVGGGVVTDLGGFVASVYKRGIDCYNIPTSLLAMVDASVGGKTGIDMDGIKNEIGTFSMPKNVLIDVHYLQTLPANQMRSGLAEIYKHALIGDADYWQVLQNLDHLTTDDLEDLIYHSVSLKNRVVLEDPKESGVRKILNFGHTLGHAVESYYLSNTEKTTLLHGEAVAIGMLLESHISVQLGLLSQDEYGSIQQTLQSVFDMPVWTREEIENCLHWLKYDKKNAAGVPQFVLLEQIGRAVYDQVVDMDLIFNAFEQKAF